MTFEEMAINHPEEFDKAMLRADRIAIARCFDSGALESVASRLWHEVDTRKNEIELSQVDVTLPWPLASG